METDKLGLNDSCRGCLSSDDLESIFECFYNEVPLAQVLMNLIPVLISENDGLSSKICELCLIKTTQAYEFQQTFLNSDKEMRAFLSNQCLDNFEVVLNSGNDLSQFNVDQIIQQTATSDERMLTATEDFVQQVDIKHEPETIQFEYGGSREKFYIEKTDNKCSLNILSEEETPPDDEMPTEDPIPVQPPVTFKAKKNYICHLCQLPTESPSKLRRHLNTHKKDKNITNTEPQTPTFDCSDCFKQFYNEASINRHKVLHSDLMKKSKMARDADEMFLCIICSAEVPDYEQLSIHMRNHKDTSEDQVFECQLCNKGYPGIKNIIRHAKTHEENG